MNVHQYITIGIAIILLGVLLFGFDKKPKNQLLIEKSRAENFENTSIDLLMSEALDGLEPSIRLFFEKKIQLLSERDTSDVEGLIDLSGEWYRVKKYALAGYYAEKVAEIQADEESWSIAGTTYAQGIRNALSEKERTFCANRAIKALQMAISLNPDNLDHRVNLGICYADFPPENNPMQGIQILLKLNEENPTHIPTLMALGRLAIQTGQWDRAIERLEKVVQLMPENDQVYCLLVQAYQGSGETNRIANVLSKCNN